MAQSFWSEISNASIFPTSTTRGWLHFSAPAATLSSETWPVLPARCRWFATGASAPHLLASAARLAAYRRWLYSRSLWSEWKSSELYVQFSEGTACLNCSTPRSIITCWIFGLQLTPSAPISWRHGISHYRGLSSKNWSGTRQNCADQPFWLSGLLAFRSFWRAHDSCHRFSFSLGRRRFALASD